MKLPRRNCLHLVVGAVALMAVSRIVWAQTYPTRPVTMVVPFAAGTAADVLGRILASGMSQTLGQQVIVENVGGAGGMNGTNRVARAAPDGYQFVLGSAATHAFSQTLYKAPLYNAATDFTPVMLVSEIPLLLVTPNTLPVRLAACRNSFLMHKRTTRRCNTDQPGSGPRIMSRVCC